jgi:Zn-dependent M28 family amino/carboxypeptidase
LIGDEVVMFGGHYDSWHAGTGATDNAAGSAVMMEVMRILKNVYDELGRGPRRTLRLALWTGEEQGLLGSKDWVEEHVAVAGDPGQAPKSIGPDYDKISAYYNLDNGSGRIRGIYLQGNEQLRPIFRRWLAPFSDMDASTITVSNTTGTDHLSFDAVGVPGFQFIQDSIEYGTRTHHTNMDVYDRLVEDDLKQAATIIASFVYNTSERNEKIPRKDLRHVLVETGTE